MCLSMFLNFFSVHLGLSQLNSSLVLNFSDIREPVSKAMDNDLETYYTSEENKNASWFLVFKAVHRIKWFLISIKGAIRLRCILN